MKRTAQFLAAMLLSAAAANCMAFVPVMYGKTISVRFEEGKFELSDHEQARLKKLIEHKDDFSGLNTFLVLAHGDTVSDNTNRDFQAMLAGARANAINSFYAQHATLQFQELIQTFTAPVDNRNPMDQAGSAVIFIQGFCKPGNQAACKEHWPATRAIERE